MILLNMKESKRVKILESWKRSEITRAEAAVCMQLSTRQAKRVMNRYCKDGLTGLVHKSRGKPNRYKTSEEFKGKALDLISTHYPDFGPTLASETLAERHNIYVHKELLRRIMIEGGIWKKRKNRPKHRSWRPPKEYRGEMTQLDGSFHAWFENRGPWCRLIKFVDDATKEMLYGKFVMSESHHAVTDATISYFNKHGKPQSMYTDKGSVFKVNKHNENDDFITQYEQSLKTIDVELIHAHSPQAKGRIERSFQTDQDRLVKYLRLENISTIEEANNYLRDIYIPLYNRKFTRPAAKYGDLHTPINDINLYDVFCTRHQRTVQNDWTIRYNTRILQITDQRPAIVKPKDIVDVFERIDGTLFLQIRTSIIEFFEIATPPLPTLEPKRLKAPIKPAKNHPWRTYDQPQYTNNKSQPKDIFIVAK